MHKKQNSEMWSLDGKYFLAFYETSSKLAWEGFQNWHDKDIVLYGTLYSSVKDPLHFDVDPGIPFWEK